MDLNTNALRLLKAESRLIPSCPILAGQTQGIHFKTTECNSIHNYFGRIENLSRLDSKPEHQIVTAEHSVGYNCLFLLFININMRWSLR